MSGTTHTNAGTYNNDTWSFTGAANYNNIAARSMTPSPRRTRRSGHGYSVTYDGNPHTATVTRSPAWTARPGPLWHGRREQTTHTNAGTYAADYLELHRHGQLQRQSGTVDDTIDKANATVVVTPYSVTYDGIRTRRPSPITGVNGETGARWHGRREQARHTQRRHLQQRYLELHRRANYNNQNGTVNDTSPRRTRPSRSRLTA